MRRIGNVGLIGLIAVFIGLALIFTANFVIQATGENLPRLIFKRNEPMKSKIMGDWSPAPDNYIFKNKEEFDRIMSSGSPPPCHIYLQTVFASEYHILDEVTCETKLIWTDVENSEHKAIFEDNMAWIRSYTEWYEGDRPGTRPCYVVSVEFGRPLVAPRKNGRWSGELKFKVGIPESSPGIDYVKGREELPQITILSPLEKPEVEKPLKDKMVLGLNVIGSILLAGGVFLLLMERRKLRER